MGPENQVAFFWIAPTDTLLNWGSGVWLLLSDPFISVLDDVEIRRGCTSHVVQRPGMRLSLLPFTHPLHQDLVVACLVWPWTRWDTLSESKGGWRGDDDVRAGSASRQGLWCGLKKCQPSSLGMWLREASQSQSGTEPSGFMQLTASFWEEISIPDKCLSNFLINFNKIKTSVGKSATQTLCRLSDVLCLVPVLTMITQPFSFPVKCP